MAEAPTRQLEVWPTETLRLVSYLANTAPSGVVALKTRRAGLRSGTCCGFDEEAVYA
jgi:phosphosulfolactate synthase (CoM biosynthesis protein A)